MPAHTPQPLKPKARAQAARYQSLLAKIADKRQRGVQVATVRLADLEALIALAASTDAAMVAS